MSAQRMYAGPCLIGSSCEVATLNDLGFLFDHCIALPVFNFLPLAS